MGHKNGGYSFCGDRLLAGNEYYCFCAVVVSDGENGVIMLGLRKFCNEVYCNHFKQLSIWLREYWGKW